MDGGAQMQRSLGSLGAIIVSPTHSPCSKTRCSLAVIKHTDAPVASHERCRMVCRTQTRMQSAAANVKPETGLVLRHGPWDPLQAVLRFTSLSGSMPRRCSSCRSSGWAARSVSAVPSQKIAFFNACKHSNGDEGMFRQHSIGRTAFQLAQQETA